jgi:hypothetical protein
MSNLEMARWCPDKAFGLSYICSFAGRAWGVLSFFSLGWGVWCTYACCIFIFVSYHGSHFCIIDCICTICFIDVLLLYTLITMICWMWAYDLASELSWCIAMLFVALRCICVWMAYFCENAMHDPLLWVECIPCSFCAQMAISCLICA